MRSSGRVRNSYESEETPRRYRNFSSEQVAPADTVVLGLLDESPAFRIAKSSSMFVLSEWDEDDGTAPWVVPNARSLGRYARRRSSTEPLM